MHNNQITQTMNYATYWTVLDTPAHKVTPIGVYLTVTIAAGVLWFLIKKFKKDRGDGERLILLWGTGCFLFSD